MKQKIKIINISTIFFWISLSLLLFILAWWVLGSSPTIEQTSLTVGLFGVLVTWKGRKDTKIIKSDVKYLIRGNSEQTQVLKDINSVLKKRL